MAIRAIKLTLGVLALIAIGVVGVHWRGGARHVQSKVSDELTRAFSAQDIAWVTIEVDGQKAVLSGAAPSNTAMREAQGIARAAGGRGGALFGPVTAIETRFTLQPREAAPEPSPAPAAEPQIHPAPAAPAIAPDIEEELKAARDADNRQRQRRVETCQNEINQLLAETPISFNTGGASIDPTFYDVLDAIGETLARCPGVSITVGGHSDATGSSNVNAALSRRRAETVAAYLEEKLSGAANIDAVGYGETQPIASNETPQGRARNRRIEIVLSPSTDEQQQDDNQ